MKNLETNTVISWGLVVAVNLSIGGWIAISIITGTNNGTEIPLSIASGLVGVLTGKKLAEVAKKGSVEGCKEEKNNA